MDSSNSIVPAPEQLPLIPSSEMDDGLFCAEEKKGSYTGSRLKVRDPKRYQAIKSLLAENIGVKRIADLLDVHLHSVQAVREMESGSIATLREVIAKASRNASHLCVDRIKEMLLDEDERKKLTLRELGIAYGILTTNAELLSGRATARVDVNAGESGHSDLEQHMYELKLEYNRRMGLEGENREQKEITPIEVGEPIKQEITPIEPDGPAQSNLEQSEADPGRPA